MQNSQSLLREVLFEPVDINVVPIAVMAVVAGSCGVSVRLIMRLGSYSHHYNHRISQIVLLCEHHFLLNSASVLSISLWGFWAVGWTELNVKW